MHAEHVAIEPGHGLALLSTAMPVQTGAHGIERLEHSHPVIARDRMQRRLSEAAAAVVAREVGPCLCKPRILTLDGFLAPAGWLSAGTAAIALDRAPTPRLDCANALIGRMASWVVVLLKTEQAGAFPPMVALAWLWPSCWPLGRVTAHSFAACRNRQISPSRDCQIAYLDRLAGFSMTRPRGGFCCFRDATDTVSNLCTACTRAVQTRLTYQ